MIRRAGVSTGTKLDGHAVLPISGYFIWGHRFPAGASSGTGGPILRRLATKPTDRLRRLPGAAFAADCEQAVTRARHDCRVGVGSQADTRANPVSVSDTCLLYTS